ncbi:MAG: hypothetical protein R3321_07520 [Nitrososphaeraceae archaeon]|nr:hypothetical protein [Nitrososphaeraceae archaeon]
MRKIFQSNPKLVKNLLFALLIMAIAYIGIQLKSNQSEAKQTTIVVSE